MAKTVRVAACIGFGGPFGREVASGVIDFCLRHPNWYVFLRGMVAGDQQAIAIAIEQWKAHGLITSPPDALLTEVIRRAGVPTVEISGQPSELWSTVAPDNRAIGAVAAEHLLERGFLSYGFCGDIEAWHSAERGAGFASTIEAQGQQCQDLKLELFSPDWIEVHRRISVWLEGLTKPAGVMACDDWTARQVIWACREAKLRVPEDVSVIGVDNDSNESHLSQVPLSTVLLPTRLIGQTAAKVLHRLMKDPGAPREVILLKPVGVIARQSTNAFGKSTPETQAALRFIAENADKPIRVGDILAHVGTSRRKLERSFAIVLQRSPGAEVLRVHLQRAQNLLAETDLKIQAVAAAAGFGSYTLFCRHFHKRTGMRPADYRRKARAELPSAPPAY